MLSKFLSTAIQQRSAFDYDMSELAKIARAVKVRTSYVINILRQSRNSKFLSVLMTRDHRKENNFKFQY